MLKPSSEQFLVADGFDEAIVGIGRQFNNTMVVYDEQKCLEILMERDHMSREEAEEFFEFNVAGAWVGESTPVFLRHADGSVLSEAREVFCKVLGEKFRNEDDHIVQFDVVDVEP